MSQPARTPRERVRHLEDQYATRCDVHSKIRLTILAFYVYHFPIPMRDDKEGREKPEPRDIPNIDMTLALITIQTLRFAQNYSSEALLSSFALYFFAWKGEEWYQPFRYIDRETHTDDTSERYGPLELCTEFPPAPAIARPDHFRRPRDVFSDGDIYHKQKHPRGIYLFKVIHVWHKLMKKIPGSDRVARELRMRWMNQFLDDSTWMHSGTTRRHSVPYAGNPTDPGRYPFVLPVGLHATDELNVRRTVWPPPHAPVDFDDDEWLSREDTDRELAEEEKDRRSDGAHLRALPFALVFILNPDEAVFHAWNAVRFTNPSYEVRDAVELFVFIICEILYTMSDVGRVNGKTLPSKADILYTVSAQPYRSSRMARYFYGGPQDRVYDIDYQSRLTRSPLITTHVTSAKGLKAFLLGGSRDTKPLGSAAVTIFIVLWVFFRTDTMENGIDLLDALSDEDPDMISRNVYSVYGALSACWYGDMAPILYLAENSFEETKNYRRINVNTIESSGRQPGQFQIAVPRSNFYGSVGHSITAIMEAREKITAYWYAEWSVSVYERCLKFHPYLGYSRDMRAREQMHGWNTRVLYDGRLFRSSQRRGHIDGFPEDPDDGQDSNDVSNSDAWPDPKRQKTWHNDGRNLKDGSDSDDSGSDPWPDPERQRTWHSVSINGNETPKSVGSTVPTMHRPRELDISNPPQSVSETGAMRNLSHPGDDISIQVSSLGRQSSFGAIPDDEQVRSRRCSPRSFEPHVLEMTVNTSNLNVFDPTSLENFDIEPFLGGRSKSFINAFYMPLYRNISPPSPGEEHLERWEHRRYGGNRDAWERRVRRIFQRDHEDDSFWDRTRKRKRSGGGGSPSTSSGVSPRSVSGRRINLDPARLQALSTEALQHLIAAVSQAPMQSGDFTRNDGHSISSSLKHLSWGFESMSPMAPSISPLSLSGDALTYDIPESLEGNSAEPNDGVPPSSEAPDLNPAHSALIDHFRTLAYHLVDRNRANASNSSQKQLSQHEEEEHIGGDEGNKKRKSRKMSGTTETQKKEKEKRRRKRRRRQRRREMTASEVETITEHERMMNVDTGSKGNEENEAEL